MLIGLGFRDGDLLSISNGWVIKIPSMLMQFRILMTQPSQGTVLSHSSCSPTKTISTSESIIAKNTCAWATYLPWPFIPRYFSYFANSDFPMYLEKRSAIRMKRPILAHPWSSRNASASKLLRNQYVQMKYDYSLTAATNMSPLIWGAMCPKLNLWISRLRLRAGRLLIGWRVQLRRGYSKTVWILKWSLVSKV